MDRLWQMNRWLAREARFLDTNLELFRQFCMKLLELGVLLDRSWLHIRALHPQYAGMARLWTRETGVEERYLDHGFEETSTYLTSPVRFAVEGRETGRWRLDAGAALPFPLLDELRAAGYVDYAIAPLLYSDGTANALSSRIFVARGSALADRLTSCLMIARSLLIFRRPPFSATTTGSFSSSLSRVERFFDPLGRPHGLPDRPVLKRVWRGGLP
jgi:adenylate cyclase